MAFRDLPIRRKLVGLILLISLSVLLLAAAVMLLYDFGQQRGGFDLKRDGGRTPDAFRVAGGTRNPRGGAV